MIANLPRSLYREFEIMEWNHCAFGVSRGKQLLWLSLAGRSWSFKHPVPVFWRSFGSWAVLAVCVSLQIAGTAESMWGKHPSCSWWHWQAAAGHAHHPAAGAASGADRTSSLCRSDREEPMGFSCHSMHHWLLIHLLVLTSSISGLLK